MTSLRILIAEDEAMIAMFLCDLLEGMGHRICATVITQDELVAAAAQLQPDLMIVDSGLAVGSGVLAVAEILERGFVPHFFVTGDRYGVRGLAPAAIVVQKPFAVADLVRAIAHAVAKPADQQASDQR